MGTSASTSKLDDKEAFERLSQILLSSDRIEVEELRKELISLKHQLQDEDKFASIVKPVFDDRVEELKKDFPDMFGPLITKAITIQIKESKDEVVNALYPIMGKLIKKYLKSELEQLKESINQSVEKIFSTKNLWRLLRAKFTGVDYADMMLSDVLRASLSNIMVIQKDSGKLLAEYPKGNPDDNLDLVAGMLSVIKSFIEDAFNKEQEVEMIEYQDNKLLIHNASNYFIVLVLDGELDKNEKHYLLARVDQFSEEHYNSLSAPNADNLYGSNSEKLKDFTEGLKKIGKKKVNG